MNNLWGVQQSIYSALVSAPATYAVYDAVPQGVVKPYIVIGEMLGDPDEEIGIYTTDASVTIHTWSNKAGKSETHAMLDFIRARLDGQVLPGSWATTEDMNEILEDAGSTAAVRVYHGIARYRVRVDGGSPLPVLGQFDLEQFA